MKKSTCIPSVEGEDHVMCTKPKRRTLSTKIVMRSQLLIVILFMACLHSFGNAKAQSVTIVSKQQPLVTILKQVETQTGYIFAYKAGVVAGFAVDVNLKGVSLEVALKEIFKGLPINYNIIEKSIVLVAKPLERPVETAAPIQQRIITGTVVDSLGSPLAGINVKIKGASVGTSTNQIGYFELNVPASGSFLVFSSVGFRTLEVAVTDQQRLRVVMSEITLQMKTVNIQTGYERVAPDRFIGSATVVDSAVLSRPVGRDLLSRLDGTTNGLLFNKGTGSLDIQLRGVSTLNTNADINGLSSQNPLFILDDFPFTGNIQNLNPNDIESITVLKDAVAMSIWGARAANGVVVIKSKSGNYNNPFSVNVGSNLTFQTKPDLSIFPQLSSSEFIDFESDLFSRGFFDLYIMFPQYFSISPVVDILSQVREGTISQSQADILLGAFRKTDLRDEALKHLYRTGTAVQNYINLSSGSNRLSYNISLGADNMKSSIKGPGGSNRYTLSSNAKFKPVKAFELTIGLDYNTDETKTDGPGYPLYIPGRGFLYPYGRLAEDDGTYVATPTTMGDSFLNSLPADKMLDWRYRPLDERDNVNQTIKTDLVRLNFGAGLRVNSWLNLDVKYQYTQQMVRDRNLRNMNTFFTRDLINTFTVPDTYVRNVPLGGILDIAETDINGHNLRGQVNVKKAWSGVHDFSAILAGELSQISSSQSTRRLYGYDGDALGYSAAIDFANNKPMFNGGESRIPNLAFLQKLNTNLVSLLMNASYTYDTRYGLYISGRRDGSNLFGVATNNKYKPLWSIGGRWNVHNEAFFDVPTLSKLSVRATYGYAGNINNSIPAISTILRSATSNYYGQPYNWIVTAPNPDLRWEQTGTVNLGLDIAVLNNRIDMTADIYRKKSTDVVASFPIDLTLGISSGLIYKNAADLETNGLDIVLTTRNITGKVSWTTNFNLNYAKTTVTKYYQEVKNVANAPVIREGDVYQGIYAYRWAGLDPANGDPRGYVGNEVSTNYQAIFNDSLKNQQYIGSFFPLLFGNMMNTISYKSFTLSANVSFRAKYYYQKPTIDYTAMYNSYANHSDYRLRWQKPGDEKTTNIPSMPYPADENRDKFFKYSAVNFEKGDHIRLQDIRLGYNWSNTRHKRFPVQSIEIFGYAGNLNVIIWKASKANYDPAYSVSVIPPLKTFSMGVNFKL